MVEDLFILTFISFFDPKDSRPPSTGHTYLKNGLHVGSNELGRIGHKMTQQSRGLLLVPAQAGMLQLDEQLNQRLAQARHDVRRIENRQAAQRADGQLADLKVLVVERDKERAEILRLGQVVVEAVVERLQHRQTHIGVAVGDAHNEELGQHLVDCGDDGGRLLAGQALGAGFRIRIDLMRIRIQHFF